MLTEKKPKKRLATLKIVLFPVLGALMFCSKLMLYLKSIDPDTVSRFILFSGEGKGWIL